MTQEAKKRYYEDTITACVLSTGSRTDRVTKTGQPFQTYSATLQTIDGDQVTYGSTSYRDAELITGQWLCVLLRHNLKQGSETEYHPPSIYGATIQHIEVEPRIGSMVVPTSANGTTQAQVSTPTRPQPQPKPEPKPEPEPQPAYYPGPVPWSTDTNLRIAWNSAFNNAISWMAAHSETLIDEHGLPLDTDDPLWRQACQLLTHQFYLVIMNGPDFNRWGPYLYVDEELPGVKLP